MEAGLVKNSRVEAMTQHFVSRSIRAYIVMIIISCENTTYYSLLNFRFQIKQVEQTVHVNSLAHLLWKTQDRWKETGLFYFPE